MKIVFFGTDAFAKEILGFLLDQGLDIVSVVTQADQPKGRSQKVEPPPVKELCIERGFKGALHQPVKASDPAFIEVMKKLYPDLFVVVSYGQIMKQILLDVPTIGTINVHPSLLPKYRGPSPIQSALLAGETETGVTIMEMELAMDAGGIIEVVKTKLDDNLFFGELEKLLCDLAKKPLLTVIQKIERIKKIESIPQDESLATYTKKIHVEDSWIDWKRSPEEICRFIRGMNPRPGARCTVICEGKPVLLKVFSARIGGLSGEKGFVVDCEGGSVELLELQLEGKRRMQAKDFINGFSSKIKMT